MDFLNPNIDFLMAVGLALLVNAIILYLIIAGATRSKKREQYEWGQLQLLAKIARAQGVPAEEIAEVFKVVDKK